MGSHISNSMLACMLAVLTSACSTVPTDPDWFDKIGALHQDHRSWFPGAGKILAGFDPPADPKRMKLGDQVLFGVCILSGESRRSWLVRFEVVDEVVTAEQGGKQKPLIYTGTFTHTFPDGSREETFIESKVLAMEISLYDEAGMELGRNRALVPRLFLSRGFLSGCRACHEFFAKLPPGGKLTGISRDQKGVPKLDHFVGAFMTFLQLAEDSKQLSPILWEAVSIPSIWTTIFSFGVNMSVNHLLDRAQPVDGGWRPTAQDQPRECYKFPLTFTANKEEVLLCSMLVTQPDSPLNLASGIVSMVGQQPQNASKKFFLQLLAARRALP